MSLYFRRLELQRKIQEEILAAAEKLENGDMSLLGLTKEEVFAKINATKLIELKKQEDDQANAIKKIEEKIRCFEDPVSESSGASNVIKVKNNEQSKIYQNYFKPQTPIPNQNHLTSTTALSYYQVSQDQMLNTEFSKMDLIVSHNLCAAPGQSNILQTAGESADANQRSTSVVSSPLPAYPPVIVTRKLYLFIYLCLKIYLLKSLI